MPPEHQWSSDRDHGRPLTSAALCAQWVGNAVGIRNYRYFVLFVGNVNLLAVYIFTTSVIYIVLQVRAEDPGGAPHRLSLCLQWQHADSATWAQLVAQIAATQPNASLDNFMVFAWDSLAALVLVAYSFVILLTVCGLFGYHLSLIMKAQTTNEDLKKVNPRTNAQVPGASPCRLGLACLLVGILEAYSACNIVQIY